MTTKATSMSQMRTTLLSCSSMNAMKRLFISEKVTLGKLLLQHRLIVLSASLGSHLMKTSNEDEFLHKIFFSTIRQIREIAQVMHVIVVGTVKAVDKDSEWYYLGCESCNCKASPSLIFPEDDKGTDDVDPKEVSACTNKNCKRDVVPAVHIKYFSVLGTKSQYK